MDYKTAYEALRERYIQATETALATEEFGSVKKSTPKHELERNKQIAGMMLGVCASMFRDGKMTWAEQKRYGRVASELALHNADLLEVKQATG